MSTNYPYALDVFYNPTAETKLGDVQLRHSLQHTNANDSLAALQARIGVVSSSITSSLDYELHNVVGGHNHDGINSKVISIGPPPYGGLNYLSGAFAFTAATDIGTVVDSFNSFFVSSSAKSSIQVNDVDFGSFNQINFLGSISSSTFGQKINLSFDALTEKSRRLSLLAEHGPFESYTSSYKTTGYLNGTTVFPTESIWFEDELLTKKIISQVVEYNAMHLITKSILVVYDIDGSTPLYTATDTIQYAGVKENFRQRTIV